MTLADIRGATYTKTRGFVRDDDSEPAKAAGLAQETAMPKPEDANAELQAAEDEPVDEDGYRCEMPGPKKPAKKPKARKARPAPERTGPSLTELQGQILAIVGPLMDAEDAGDEKRAAQLADALEALGHDLDTKTDGYVHVIRRFESLASERKGAAADLAEMARADANRAKRIKARLLEAMEALGQDKAGHLHRVTLVAPSRNKVVVTGDVSDMPTRYTTTTLVTKPNKDAIEAALARGEALPFAELQPVAPHLRIK